MNIIDKVQKILEERRKEYGTVEDSFRKISEISSLLLSKEITEKDICIINIVMKLVRHGQGYKEDNLIDIIGYTFLLNEFH